jgi:hypothetical protein
MTRRSFLARMLAATLLPASAAAQSLEPVDVDWDRVFRVTWEMGERYRKPHVIGRIENISGLYGAAQIQLLVERLDARGQPAAQQVVWLGFRLNPGEHGFFDVPVSERATYRVRVYAFSRKIGTPGG